MIYKNNPYRDSLLSVYPNDRNLTALERKEYTNRFLKSIHLDVADHLPLIEDFNNVRIQEKHDIACRAVILAGLIDLAYDKRSSIEIHEYFKTYNLLQFASTEEMEYLTKTERTKTEKAQMSWRKEALNVLFWALNKFDLLVFPDSICDFTNYNFLPDLDSDPSSWIENSTLRNSEAILNETDLIYRIHWAVKDARINGNEIPAQIISGVVYERHIALNWLTMYAEDWDDVTADT